MKFAIKPIRHYPPHLRHVATLLWEIKNTNFCRYSADMKENANKLHFTCTYFNSSVRITVLWVYLCVFIKILSLSLNTMLIVDKHCSDVCCDKFPVPQIDRKSKQIKNSDMANFNFNQYGGQLAILNTENIKMCGWITKLVAINMQFVCIYLHICWISAENLNC